MKTKRHKFYGLPISPGIAIGQICLIGTHVIPDKAFVKHKTVETELEKLKQALNITRNELEEIKKSVKKDLGEKEAEIFDLQILMTSDPYFLNKVEHKVAVDLKNVAWAIEETIDESMRSLQQVEDPFLRERYHDIKDIGSRILNHILENQQKCFFTEHEDIIIAAENLVPSQTVDLRTQRIRGFVTEKGGTTGHAAILARSLGVPLISGIFGLTNYFSMGVQAIVDGYRGEVIINPTAEDIKLYSGIKEIAIRRTHDAEKLALLPSTTKDKFSIDLFANISNNDDILNARRVGAEGVGLYRTELHFMSRTDFATEEIQYEDYKTIVKSFDPLPVVIRTLDLGGDKFLGANIVKEPNPYLGLRAIRLSLRHPDVFKIQLRAILRAAACGQVKLLIPMISSIEEVLQVKNIVADVIKDLQSGSVEFNPNVPLGIMVEIPSTAIQIKHFLKHVDFVSVGTNDLIQYTLAVDRGNENVSAFYQPFHPSVLKLLQLIALEANDAGKEASVCGEIAGDPLFTELLIGFGYKTLSMSSPFIPHVKMRARQLTLKSARQAAQKVLEFELASQVRDFAEKRMHNAKT